MWMGLRIEALVLSAVATPTLETQTATARTARCKSAPTPLEKLFTPAGVKSFSRGVGALLHLAVLAVAVCVSSVGVATADNTSASMRKPIHIAAQDLGPALKQLAQSRGLQVLYLFNTVRDLRTRGANGDITANEAFDQLLDGTGLTFRYLDENTVTVVPLSDPSVSEESGASLPVTAGNPIAADSPARQAKSATSDGILLAQAAPASVQQAPPAPADSQPLQEIIVTGSRIAAPNEVSTSPIQVISAQSI